MKFAVGVMLTSFGMFWGAEGAGASWPGGDARAARAHPGRAARFAGMVLWLRRAAGAARDRGRRRMSRLRCRGVWEFVVGDDWVTAAGVVAALALTALIAGAGVAAWWVMPVAVVALLALSLRRAMRR